ncbi:hypothetical protein JKF63_05968 [Porcisia hertigi]|uniref:Uncharacterized protein n=1 Tax=Porcisia hertigi TaxID=2761500 RepID=A0A836LFK6_9TRYP|nr:hypothetical protein JKF63_05968 [Porcisia hertigi]
MFARLSVMRSSTLLLLLPPLTSMGISSDCPPTGRPIVASCVAGSALLGSRRGYATTAASNAGGASPAIQRLPTATEADTELQAWVNSAPGTSSSPMSHVSLSGRSFVLCVAALQLHETTPAAQTRNRSSPSFQEQVRRYLCALALHISARFNAPGKPSAAAVLYADVESAHIRPESLRTSLQYLAHEAFRSNRGTAAVSDDGSRITSNSSPTHAEVLIAKRDLELTLEATLVLLEGHQIWQVHHASMEAKKTETATTTAAMMPHAESACYHIRNVVDIISKPLAAPPAPSVAVVGQAPTAALSLPSPKREFWTRTARQLTSVLYVALLSTQSKSRDAQIMEEMFGDVLRKVYGAEKGKFGMSRSLHYTVTVVLPFVSKSFTMIADMLQRQQRAAAAKNGLGSRRATSGSTGVSSLGSSRPRSPLFASVRGPARAADGMKTGSSSERMRQATLLMLCVAAALYMVSSWTELFSWATPSSSQPPPPSAFTTAKQTSDRDAMEIYKKLSAMATSATTERMK